MSDDGAEVEIRTWNGWEEYYDENVGTYYYVNNEKTTWERPDGFPELQEEAGAGEEADEDDQDGDSGNDEWADAESEEEVEGKGDKPSRSRFMSASEELEDHGVGGGEQQLPPEWKRAYHEGTLYYYNESTDETSWEFPTGKLENIEEEGVENEKEAEAEDEEEEEERVNKGEEKEANHNKEKKKKNSKSHISDATANYVRRPKSTMTTEDRFNEIQNIFPGTSSPTPFFAAGEGTGGGGGGGGGGEDDKNDAGAEESRDDSSLPTQSSSKYLPSPASSDSKSDHNTAATHKAEELLTKPRGKKAENIPGSPSQVPEENAEKSSPESTKTKRKLKRHKSQFLLPEVSTEGDKAVASKLQISPDHVANLRYLQTSVKDYVAFLKGDAKFPPDLTFHDFKGPSLQMTKFSAKGTEYPRRLNMFEQELSRQLRIAQRERDEYSKAMSLHRPPTKAEMKKMKPKGFHPQNSSDPLQWIKAMRHIVAERDSEEHVIGLLLKDKDKKSAICTNMKDSCEELNQIVDKVMKSIKTERAEKVEQKESTEELTKLREENLNLKTNLEMMTYDLAEFDELSLETQMLREGQFRAEKRIKEYKEEIMATRRETLDWKKQMDNLKEEQAKEIEKIHLDALHQLAEKDNGESKIEVLNRENERLNEDLQNRITENTHLSERIAAAMEDLAKQRLAYEEVAEEGVKAMREKERAVSENKELVERMEQMQDSYNKASLFMVKEQYLSQQVKVLNGEVKMLSENKEKLLKDRNLLRRTVKEKEGELQFVKSDFENYKSLSEGQGNTRGALINARAINKELMAELEEVKDKLSAMKGLEEKVAKLEKEKAALESSSDQANVAYWENRVSHLSGLVAAYEHEEVADSFSSFANSDYAEITRDAIKKKREGADGWKKKEEGVGGGGGGRKGFEELEIQQESKKAKEMIEKLRSEIRTLQNEGVDMGDKLEKGNRLSKGLHSQISNLQAELAAAKEAESRAQDGKKELVEAVRSAILGTSNDMGEKLIALAEIPTL